MRPWGTRNNEECETCRFWDDDGDAEDENPREGKCYRFPPVRNHLPAEEPGYEELPPHAFWSYPKTGGHWWCGEWKLRREIGE